MAAPSEQTQQQSKNEFLYADNNSTACIILVEKACEQYQQLTNKNNVPFSYIEFFVSEFDKYSTMFNDNLKDFFVAARKSDVTTEDMVERYIGSYYAQNSDLSFDQEEKYLVFDDKISTLFTDKMREITNTVMSAFIENILAICKKIDMQDELLNPLELYERYMIKKVVLSRSSFEKHAEHKKRSKAEDAPQTATTLIGNQIDDKYQQSGKITKVVIPKLNLPTSYPINLDESRIILSKKASKFCSASSQIIFINKNKIVNTKYSSDFIKKRKKKPKKNQNFNWDF